MSGLFNRQPVYNEIDAHACAWLRRLITAGHIGRGRVVEEDIRELDPADIGRARRFHAFAGIGLWDHALWLAGWPTELAVWTGSCPCQPFSVAGRKRGTADERHLWPAWFRLIRECCPPVVFGEQVASPAGRAWLDAVSADLEALGYAVGAADLCAAGVGAPHLRQRIFFVAHRQELRRGERRALRRWSDEGVRKEGDRQRSADAGGVSDLADMSCEGLQAWPDGQSRRAPLQPERHGDAGDLDEPHIGRQQGTDVHLRPTRKDEAQAGASGAGTHGLVGDAGGEGSGRDSRAVPDAQGESHQGRQSTGDVTNELELAGYTRGCWADAEWLACRDGKARPIEPGTFPLAHGHSGRVAVVRTREQAGTTTQETHWYNRAGALKCIGNAIVPQVAAIFIEASLRTIYDEFV